MRIIKVTESQLRITEGDAYSYIDDEKNDIPHYSQTQISAQGYVDDAEFGGPLTTDQADVMTPQHWYRGYRGTAATTFAPNMDVLDYDRHPYINESDSDNDGYDDMYDVDDEDEIGILDTLGDDNEGNDLQKVPFTIQRNLNRLIQCLGNVASKVQIQFLNYLINKLGIKNIPYSWNSMLVRKTKMRNNITDNGLSQTTEVDTNNHVTPTLMMYANDLINNLSKYNDQQKAIVINKLIETLDIHEVPYKQGKNLSNTISNQHQNNSQR